MGWSFRKSFKLIPGVRLNLSRRGISTSVGVKGFRLLLGGGRKPRINAGLGPFRYTQTLSASAMHTPQLPPSEPFREPEFDLPSRGRYEANATVIQKNKLEKIASSTGDLPERFYELLDGLGRDQARYILDWHEAVVLARQQEEQRIADEAQRIADEAYIRRVEYERNKGQIGCIPSIIILVLGSVGVFYLVSSYLNKAGNGSATTSQPTVLPAPPSLSPSPVPRLFPVQPTPTSPSKAFLTDVGYSSAAAVAKYPDLGVAGSVLNRRFNTRLAEWKAHHDPRLVRSDWPERLADDISAHP